MNSSNLNKMYLKVYNIFEAFEGEGINIGSLETFIRLSGCPIKCATCDTPEALDINSGYKLSIEAIARSVVKLRNRYVVITGGEPLLQAETLHHLVRYLVNLGYYTILETSGQMYDDKVFRNVNFISADAKTPSSGINVNWTIHETMLRKYSTKLQVKLVIKDRRDLKFGLRYAKWVLSKWPEMARKVIFTPCWEKGEDLDVEWVKHIHKCVKRLHLPVRVIPQVHKIIYGSMSRDV